MRTIPRAETSKNRRDARAAARPASSARRQHRQPDGAGLRPRIRPGCSVHDFRRAPVATRITRKGRAVL